MIPSAIHSDKAYYCLKWKNFMKNNSFNIFLRTKRSNNNPCWKVIHRNLQNSYDTYDIT